MLQWDGSAGLQELARSALTSSEVTAACQTRCRAILITTSEVTACKKPVRKEKGRHVRAQHACTRACVCALRLPNQSNWVACMEHLFTFHHGPQRWEGARLSVPRRAVARRPRLTRSAGCPLTPLRLAQTTLSTSPAPPPGSRTSPPPRSL